MSPDYAYDSIYASSSAGQCGDAIVNTITLQQHSLFNILAGRGPGLWNLFSPCLYGFLPQSKYLNVRLLGDSKLVICVNVRLSDCQSLQPFYLLGST